MVIILMGVSGAGKTTVGMCLAKTMNWRFVDADSFHSEANVRKMAAGIALDDEDRAPWLAAMAHAIAQWLLEDSNVVLACSALKASYRDVLSVDRGRVRFVYIKGSYELIRDRLVKRSNHFMSDKLLISQMETLEEPHDALQVDAAANPAVIVEQIKRTLNL
jgi:gluconokinase